MWAMEGITSLCRRAPASLLLLQQPPHDLAAAALGQGRHKLHRARAFVDRHVLAAPVEDVLLGGGGAVRLAQHHHGLHALTPVGVMGGDHAGFGNGGVLEHEHLHLGGPDLEATGVDHAFEPVGDEVVAVFVHPAQVARAEEAFSIKGQDGQVWTPQNYDRKAHGTIYLYQGLAQSYNLSTAKLGLEIGVPNVLKTLERLGVERKWPAYPSMLLGAGALTPMEVAGMYQTLANGGFNTPLRGIRSVLTADGEPLGRYPFQIQQRFDPGAIYLVQNAMQRTMREGTGRSVYSQLPSSLNLAGKTGTSNDSRDSWFAGFSQDVLAVVWLGRDDNGPTPLTGATGALQVWTDFMRKADPLPLDMPVPDNVVQAWVDASSGQGTDPSCPNAVQMPYIRGSQPVAGPACGIQAPVNEVMDWVRGWLD